MSVGDFNEVLMPSEKMGGNLRRQSLMLAFQHTLEVCELIDLGFLRPKYTWSNCQEGSALIRERLDRGVANISWRSFYPDAEVAVQTTTASDHAPILVSLMRQFRCSRKQPRFFYEACWARERGYSEVIHDAWKNDSRGGTNWDRLGLKLKACVRGLTMWRKKWKGHVHDSISKHQKTLLQLQTKEDEGAERGIKKVQDDLGLLLDQKDLWWRQRAKEEWLKSGDRNTRFFHAYASARRRRNYVGMIKDEHGLNWDTTREAETAFERYFSNLFTKGPDGDTDLCLQPITSRVSEEMNLTLERAITMEEIEVALFQIVPLKAPGSDGLNACFFQHNWPTMKERYVK